MINPAIKQAVIEYLTKFKQHTMENVLETNVSVIISKDAFVNGIDSYVTGFIFLGIL